MLVVVSTALAWLGADAALWLVAPVGEPFVTHDPFLHLVLEPNTAWMPNLRPPVTFTTDELGFRVTSPVRYDAKPAGTMRVFLIGGSTTENMYVDDRRTFAALLERRLNEALAPGGRAEVVNAGRGGTGSADHYYLARQVMRYQPDAVVYLMGANDMVLYLRTGAQPVASAAKARVRSAVMTSQILRRVTTLYRRQTAAGSVTRDGTGSALVADRARSQRAALRAMPEDAQAVAPAYVANVRSILALHRQHQVKAIFMTQPVLWHRHMDPALERMLATTPGGGVPYRYAPGDLETLIERYNDVLRTEGAAEPLAEVVDLARTLPKDAQTFYDDMHFTDLAQPVIANALFDALAPARGTSYRVRSTPHHAAVHP